MWQANWISLGIIVTLFACMVQRLASSMRLTKKASAASCRHIMVLPWKRMSVLPSSSHEKGSFRIRSSVLFWNCQVSWGATVPGQYFLVFFTCPTLRNSFQGALPPTVGWSFLLTGSSADGPASAAIWANCQVGNNNGDWPTSSSHLASSTHLSALSNVCSTSLMGEGFLAGEGWCTGEGGLLPFFEILLHSSSVLSTFLPSLSFLGVTFVLAILSKNKKRRCSKLKKDFYKVYVIKNLH